MLYKFWRTYNDNFHFAILSMRWVLFPLAFYERKEFFVTYLSRRALSVG